MSITEEAVAFWSQMDELAAEKYGINCGVPQGIMQVGVTTNYKPLADLIAKMNPEQPRTFGMIAQEALDGKWVINNSWVTARPWKGSYGRVFVLKSKENGKCRKLFFPHDPHLDRLDMATETMQRRASYALRQSEEQAQKRLFQELSEYQRNQYVTGDFVFEKGRSGVGYLIRKNRPTLAMRQTSEGEPDHPLCALCLHPVAYYTETWAGVLPPSDEVLTHLLMIRQDERFYWRKANQIPLDQPTSGV